MNRRKAKKLLKAQQQVSLSRKQEQISSDQERFKQLYLEFGTIGATLKEMGYSSRTTFYDWCESNPAFKAWYEKEGQPFRRDIVASVIYRAALGKIQINNTRFISAIAFLKATEVRKEKIPDDLVFTEKNQFELTGKGGGPVRFIEVEEAKSNEVEGSTRMPGGQNDNNGDVQ